MTYFYPRVFLLVCLCCITSLCVVADAYADNTIIIIDEEEIVERVKGGIDVRGEVVDVSKDRITIETTSGDRVRVDVDDIRFPKDLDEIIKEGMMVEATGKERGVALLAHRLETFHDHKVYTSKTNINVKVKGKKDYEFRIKNF